jgi:hypothetical protein
MMPNGSTDLNLLFYVSFVALGLSALSTAAAKLYRRFSR